jgi:hypothetical protein
MFVPFTARRHNQCAWRHNHRVLKAHYLYLLPVKPEGRPIVSKGISIVPNHYWCSFH